MKKHKEGFLQVIHNLQFSRSSSKLLAGQTVCSSSSLRGKIQMWEEFGETIEQVILAKCVSPQEGQIETVHNWSRKLTTNKDEHWQE